MTTLDKYFILVKDITKQSEYIFNDIPIDSNCISKTFDIVLQSLKKDITTKNIIINKNDTYCEIIEQLENVKNGYLWTTNSVSNNVLFIISLVKTQSNYLEKTITQLVTDLMNVRVNTINDSLKFIHEKINKLEEKNNDTAILHDKLLVLSDNLNDATLKFQDTTYIKQLFTGLLDDNKLYNENFKSPVPKDEKKLDNFINKFDGYAYEPSTYMRKDIFTKENSNNTDGSLIDFSDNYIIELKEKLSLPNYGLLEKSHKIE